MMGTRITVVDGCDGLTPDMLRCVPDQRTIDRMDRFLAADLGIVEDPKVPPGVVYGFPVWYFQDRMHE